MKSNTWNGFNTPDKYVADKMKKLSSYGESDFSVLYDLMFSESGNVIFEKSNGYKIEKTTYGECRQLVEERAAALKAQLSALPQNSVVGLYMDNGLDWIVAFWAILRCSFKPLLINMRLPEGALCAALSSCGVAAVVSDGRVFNCKTVLYSSLTDGKSGELTGGFGEEVLFMSSGTSEHVKICAYTARSLVKQLFDVSEIIRDCKQIKKHYHGNLKLLAFLPFYHIFGFCAVYLWFCFFSRTLVYLKDLSPDTLLNTVRRHEVTHIFAVPLFWESVYSQAMRTIKARGEKTYNKFKKGLKLSNALGNSVLGRGLAKKAFAEVRENLFGESVCFCIAGGSMISRPVLEFFNGIGYRLVNGYGMTEIGITSVELSSSRKQILACSVGKPFSSVDYSVNGEGELLARGQSLADYVIEDGVRKERTEGWFCTHDLVKCEKGKYYILGRADELLVGASGENLNPNLIEPQFALEGVREVCLILDGESPALLVGINEYTGVERAQEILSRVKARAEEASLSALVGKIMLIVTPLIEGEEFKLNRRRIAKDFASGKIKRYDFAAREAESGLSALEKKVLEIFAAALSKGCEETGVSSDFFTDEGGTSLDYFSFAAQIKREFGVDILAEKGRALTSVKAVAEYVKELGV